MTDVIISAHRLSWDASLQHGSEWDQSKVMLKIRQKILTRDDYTCQGCGWRSEKFQEIHHKNDDHSDFKEKNLETLCPLCHQVFHPASASISGGGFMIWLPELSQVDLNRLLFPLFAILKSGQAHPLFSVAKAVWGLLEMRKVYLENQIGKSDPGFFGQVLLSFSADDYKNRKELTRAIKMLASPLRFETEITYWKACFDAMKNPEQWISETQSILNMLSAD